MSTPETASGPPPAPATPPAAHPSAGDLRPVPARGEMTRRGFLGTLTSGWVAFYLFIGGNLAAIGRYFFPNVLYEPPNVFEAGKPDEYVKGQVNERWKKEFRVWVVRNDEGLYAMLAMCTHLGCTPNWFADENRFKCPCHGSQYDILGRNVAGPAPKPLFRCALKLASDGQLQINKGQLLDGLSSNWFDKTEQKPWLLKA